MQNKEKIRLRAIEALSEFGILKQDLRLLADLAKTANVYHLSDKLNSILENNEDLGQQLELPLVFKD